MATNDTPDFDDLEPVETNEQNGDYDNEWIDLEPGESVVGEVRAVKPNCGEYDNTVIELARGIGDVVAMWSNGQIDRAFRVNDLGEGDVVGIKHTEDTATTENDDGEEIEFDIWEVRALGGDD